MLSMSYIPILRSAERGHAKRTAPVRFTSLGTQGVAKAAGEQSKAETWPRANIAAN
jgi:hypothetical protein